MSTVGARIKTLRQSQGLSQQAISGDGISPGYVSLVESGKRNPSIAMVQRFADRLGVSAEQLVVEHRSMASAEAQLSVNFAKLALANSDPRDAVAALDSTDLDRLDSRTASEASLVLAAALRVIGDLDRAVEVLDSLSERCRREHSWLTLAQAATLLTLTYIESGDVAQSVETAQRAVQDILVAGLEGTEEHLRLGSVLVSALYERGDLVYATRTIQKLIAVADSRGSAASRGAVYWTAATVAHERGRVTEALQLTDRALAVISEINDTIDLPRLRLNYAFLLLSDGSPQPVLALDQLDQAEAHPALAASKLDLGTAAMFRGRARLMLDEVQDAAEHAAQALQLLGPSEHVERVSALLLLGDVGAAQRNMDLAHEAYREAEQVLSHMTPSRQIARLWRELGDALRALSDLGRAADAYDQGFRVLGLAPRPLAGQASRRPTRDAWAAAG